MTKSEKFAELLFDSSLEEEVKKFILENLDNFSEEQKNEIFDILEKDVKNIENIEKMTEIQFQNEKNKFEKESKKLELEFLKEKLEKK